MGFATALDLSQRRYATPSPRVPAWVTQTSGPARAYLRPARSSRDGRRLLLELAQESRPGLETLRGQTSRMLRQAQTLTYRNRRAVVSGMETCAFGTFLATFLSCLWLLG